MNIRTPLLCLLILLSPAVSAVSSWYQVEVIIFDRLYPDLDGEQWLDAEFTARNNLLELQATNYVLNTESELLPFMMLESSKNRLNGAYRVLKLSSEYRPLIHLSWQQPATKRRESRYVHLQKMEGEVLIPAAELPEENTITLIDDEPEFLEDLVMPERIVDGSIRIR